MPKTPKQMEKILKKDGWRLIRTNGSHRIYKHPTKEGIISLPFHSKDLGKGIEKQILKDAQIGGK